MAKIIPLSMSVEEFMLQKSDWATKRRLCNLYSLSNDALTLRLRSFRGRVELLTVKGTDGVRFLTRLYKRSQVRAAVASFTRRRVGKRSAADPHKWLDAHEAAELLGFSRAESFNGWLCNCERKPNRRKKWRNFPSGKARSIFVYEKESLLECRNWFLQRKRQEDRLPSLGGGSCGVDALSAGVDVWEHMGYSRKEALK